MTAQLTAKAVRVKTGTIVNATIIASASEGATTFERHHPVSLAIIVAFGWTASEEDTF